MSRQKPPMIYYIAMPQRVEASLQDPYDLPLKSDFQICPACGVRLSHRPNKNGRQRSHFKHRHAPDFPCPLYDSHGGGQDAAAKPASRTKPDFTIAEWISMLRRAASMNERCNLDWMDGDPTVLLMLNTASSRLARSLPPPVKPTTYVPGRLTQSDMDAVLLASLSHHRNRPLRHELMKIACHTAGRRWRPSKGRRSPLFLFQDDDQSRTMRLDALHPGYIRPIERQAIHILNETAMHILKCTRPTTSL